MFRFFYLIFYVIYKKWFVPTVQIFTGVFSIENTDGTLVQNTGGVMEIGFEQPRGLDYKYVVSFSITCIDFAF